MTPDKFLVLMCASHAASWTGSSHEAPAAKQADRFNGLGLGLGFGDLHLATMISWLTQ